VNYTYVILWVPIRLKNVLKRTENSIIGVFITRGISNFLNNSIINIIIVSKFW